jgi:hypothetical protein
MWSAKNIVITRNNCESIAVEKIQIGKYLSCKIKIVFMSCTDDITGDDDVIDTFIHYGPQEKLEGLHVLAVILPADMWI